MIVIGVKSSNDLEWGTTILILVTEFQDRKVSSMDHGMEFVVVIVDAERISQRVSGSRQDKNQQKSDQKPYGQRILQS